MPDVEAKLQNLTPKRNLSLKIARNKQVLRDKFFSLTPLTRMNILALFVGLVGGLGSWVFRVMIEIIFFVLIAFPQEILESVSLSEFVWILFLVAPVLGGVMVGILTQRVSEETKGHGVPEVLEAVVLHGGKMRLRVPFVKILASAATLGSGGSAGREGPIAQIGAGFGSLLGQKLNLSTRELRTLVISGVGAGISATFNAPIGGALFAFEILSRGSSISLFIPIIIASVVGTVVGQILLGTNPAFVFPPFEYHNAALIPLFIFTGILAGVGAAAWIKFFYKAEDFQEGLFEKTAVPKFLQPAMGGLFVGVILVITYFFAGSDWKTYTTMGRTYLPIDAVFNGFLTTGTVITVLVVLMLLFILKTLSTVLSIGSGGSGGVFAPTLFLGVMLGAIIGVIGKEVMGISSIQVAVFALIGMAAFFAGTGRAPLTAIIMTAEMTGDYFLTIPLMFAVAFSFFIASHLEKNDIYILKLTRRGTKIEEPIADILETITIAEAMTPRNELITIDTKMRLEEVVDLVRKTKHEGFPVFDDEDFVGVVTLSDVHDALQEHPKGWIVGDIIKDKEKEIICSHRDASLAHAVAIMVRRDISRLPVVNQYGELVGWLTHHDITQKYVENQTSQVLREVEERLLTNHLQH